MDPATILLWGNLISGLIRTGASTIGNLKNAFGAAHPELSEAERNARWDRIISVDRVQAAIAHRAAGEPVSSGQTPPQTPPLGPGTTE